MGKKYKIKELGIFERVKFKVDKKAFEHRIVCCGKQTKKVFRKENYKGLAFSYDVWKCSKCGEEYLDNKQAERLEKLWTIQKIIDDSLITIERTVNFDGKTYFFRFPKEITKDWGRNKIAEIKLINPMTFLVEVKVR